MRYALVLVLLLGTSSMFAAPAAAARKQHGPSCTRIRDALAGGQSADDVAKDMKVSAATVQRCSATKAKAPAHRSAKSSSNSSSK